MNRFKVYFFLTFLLLLSPMLCRAQAKVYTMKMKLADFPSKTTMVVLEEDTELSEATREAVLHFWRISPYEFCTEKDYESKKRDNSLYFLRPVEKDGYIALELSKGGKDKSSDSMKERFSVVEMPVGDQYEHFGAFIDILQDFISAAMESDVVGYAGLKYRNGAGASHLRGLTRKDPERIGRATIGKCTIMYDKLTHELCYFRK